MAVPNTFGTATSAIPLSQLDANFNTPITLGNTAIQLGDTVTTLNNMTLANVTISSGNVTITNVAITTANVSGTANISTLVVVGNATVGGNTTITGNITAANANVTTNLVLSGGTANGVAYLNTSKVLTTGSALVFDGTNLGIGGTNNSYGSQTAMTLSGTNVSRIDFRSNSTFTGTILSYQAVTEGLRLQTEAGYPITFYPAGTEAMRIGVATGGVGAVGIGYTTLTSVGNNGLAVLGNVGIGTSSPGNKLTVKPSATSSGTLDVLTGSTNTDSVRISGGGTVNTWLEMRGYLGVKLYSDATNTVTVDSSGNLGLGVTPDASDWNASMRVFHAYQNTTNGAGVKLQSSNAKMIMSAGNAINYIGSIGATPIQFVMNSSAAMTLDASGNLGVGTTSPGAKLEVNQEATAFPGFKITGSNSPGMQIVEATGVTAHFVNDSAGVYVGSSTSYPLILRTNNTERARIDTSGIVTMNAYGAGAATFSAAGVISSVSDETWKIKDGVPVDPDSMLKKLEPGYWYYNDEKKETFGADRQLGFYAQNVNAAIGPEAAPTPEEGKPWGYYDRSVLAVTVMSLQKALATIEALTARITALEGA